MPADIERQTPWEQSHHLQYHENPGPVGPVVLVDTNEPLLLTHIAATESFVVGADKKLTTLIELESGDSGLTRERGGHIAFARKFSYNRNPN